jgi:hypothetical protein
VLTLVVAAVLASYLPEYRDSLKRVLESGTFTECVVYSGLPESAHSHYPELGGGLFKYEPSSTVRS